MTYKRAKDSQAGFSLMELMIAMVVMMLLLGIVSMVFSRSMGVKARESRKTDALTAAQAAMNVLSREISNSGFGISSATNPRWGANGIVLNDSGSQRIHVRSNINNVSPYSDPTNINNTNDAGEDITYFFDSATDSIVRFDRRGTPVTSVVVNRISDVRFDYFDYVGAGTVTGPNTTPTANTGRVRITVLVRLDPVQGQPNNQTVSFVSDVTLRNSNYMLQQY
jgi:type II secretory pathway pseudopilin PulG